jgi:hypothetical protein
MAQRLLGAPGRQGGLREAFTLARFQGSWFDPLKWVSIQRTLDGDELLASSVLAYNTLSPS